AGQLAPTCVYDDGCHLVKYIKKSYWCRPLTNACHVIT
ncbi:unnamed protein product, partial [Rotaria magnacalcarata]